MVEMYRFVTDTGEAVYYAGADFMEGVRSWFVGSNYVSTPSLEAISAGTEFYDYSGNRFSCPDTVTRVIYNFECPYNGPVKTYELLFSTSAMTYLDKTATYVSANRNIAGVKYAARTSLISRQAEDARGFSFGRLELGTTTKNNDYCIETLIQRISSGEGLYLITTDGLTFADFISSPIDGTSARAWSETYANRGLYIASGGNQGAPDDGAEGNDGWKFLLPLSLASAAILAAMSQTEQWTGTTPPEFDDYTEKEELTVTPAPEFDGYQAIEIAPVTNPNPDPNPDPGPGSGSDPDSGGDSAELNWWQRFSQWFLDLRTSINELPNRFDEHFENVNNNIQELPNKFETWIQNVQTSVDSVAESILGTADEINAAISNLPNAFFAHVQNILSAIAAVPQAIVSGIKNVLTELFVPDPEFIPNKVEALKAEYEFLDPMLGTGEDLKLFFQNIGFQPPIIWIDLGAGTDWHPMGGKVKFIDLTWYSQYKPTVDPIVGGFIWLWVAWRMFKAVPGLLTGDSGTVGAPIIVPDLSFNQARLPAGRSRRKKDGE